MKRLVMMVGLPRSGKSTFARGLGFPIVNPDSIRLALHGQRFLAEAEPMVWAMARYMVEALFLAGHETVVLDATNTTNVRRDTWVSPRWRRQFVVFDTPKEVCMERALADHSTLLLSVIEKMDAEYVGVCTSELREWEKVERVRDWWVCVDSAALFEKRQAMVRDPVV
jgi:predicted kinase